MTTPSFASLSVNTKSRTYDIHIGVGLIHQKTCFEPFVQGKTVVICSNEVVMPLYGNALSKTLEQAGARKVLMHVWPDGEDAKHWGSIDALMGFMLSNHCDRKTVLIALGGGVVGDMVGFAAAIYMRGIPFIQVPTTLLSMVDSSVGGKTGINHPLGKNMIGAFHQPNAVFADMQTLQTLPIRELRAGLAEVIKHGAIASEAYFKEVEQNIEQLLAFDLQQLQSIVYGSCLIKANVVSQDETEQGIRATLNFGHTFGHAIEAGLGYGTWVHGEAVGCGMIAATMLSERLGMLKKADAMRIHSLIEQTGLPTVLPNLGSERYLQLMSKDKKNDAGKIRYVLLNKLGSACVSEVDDSIVIEVLNALNPLRANHHD